MKLRLGATTLDLTRPLVMGVLNVTADSFSDGGRFIEYDAAMQQAGHMVDAGAAIIDVGGESTRPGAEPVSESAEIDRVVPIVDTICGQLGACVSVDTSKPAVMQAAFDAGASLINDVYALRQDGALEMAAGLDVGVCLMHMQGEPRSMQQNPRYDDVTAEVSAFLATAIERCRAAGIDDERIVVDPGFGFGKTDVHNFELLANLQQFTELGLPLLVGLSRKRTLGNLTGRSEDERLAAGLAAAMIAVDRGARIVRTHDVIETVDALKVLQAVLAAEQKK